MSRAFVAVPLELTDGVSEPAHAGSIGGMAKRRRKLGLLWCGIGLGLVVIAVGIGWHQIRAKHWLAELSLAREAMKAGRFGLAQSRLSQLAEQWTNDGEVLMLLGECEMRRGRREEALAAWAKVPPSAPFFAQAARLQAVEPDPNGQVLAG